MTRSSPHMHVEVPIASITAVTLWGCGGGAAPSSLHIPGGVSGDPHGLAGGSARRHLPHSAAVSCHKHSPFEPFVSSYVQPEIQVAGCSCCGSPEAEEGTQEQGDAIRASAFGVLVAIRCRCSLLQDTTGGRFLPV